MTRPGIDFPRPVKRPPFDAVSWWFRPDAGGTAHCFVRYYVRCKDRTHCDRCTPAEQVFRAACRTQDRAPL